jgi:molybdenum cofactor cytidylyltransferase
LKFGPVALAEAEGGIVAHAIRQSGIVLKKGELVRSADLAALKDAGVAQIVVARLEPGDLGEDEAARRIADSVAGLNVRVEAPFTGRSNLFSECNGVLLVDPERIDAINDLDERVTIATLPPYRAVVEGEMIATVKIIPFAVPARLAETAAEAARHQPITVRPYQSLRVGVISTLLPGLKPTTIAKTLRVLEERLAPARATIVLDQRVDHDAAALTQAIAKASDSCDILVIFGASAITDRRDVIPAALEAAGGEIEHFGMPVDPGNLLLIGRLGTTRVLGAPGCARSPKENGFDWVLQRMLAGIDVQSSDIRRMGAGGLLMEIISRGQPRSGEPPNADD